MSSLVGFTLHRGLTDRSIKAALKAQGRALRHFPHLKSASLAMGNSVLDIWGHPELEERICIEPNSAISALIGSPHGKVELHKTLPHLFCQDSLEKLEIPWEGRTILLRIDEGGKTWTLWNDWVGSIPIYYARIGQGWIVSTLETVIVAAAAFSAEDIFLPGVVSQLINGFCFGDWTMFRGMKVVPSDCCAKWRNDEFAWKHRWTVVPTENRWQTGWDDLVEEMHQLSIEAIAGALERRSHWILPLSSGLDSRLIAAAGVEMGVNFDACSWGNSDATDVIFGRRIARRLKLPWKHIDLGREYLLRQTSRWLDLFGSAMHAHGMYQMEFFDRVGCAHEGYVSGYLGEVLTGDENSEMVSLHAMENQLQIYNDHYVHWTVPEARTILKPSLDEAMAEIKKTLRDILEAIPGAFFQKAQLLDFWTRQCRFTGFHAILADYYGGVATPFISRAYSRFCFSLPRAAYERRLLADVYRKYFARVAAIPGSYGPEPFILTGRYLLKRRLAQCLPLSLRNGIFRGTKFTRLNMDLECIRAHGWKSLWPIRDAWENLSHWVHMDQISRIYESIMAGNKDMKLVRKLQSIQALAYRLLSEDQIADGSGQRSS